MRQSTSNVVENMQEYSLARLVHIVQAGVYLGDQAYSQAALEEIHRRGFDYEDLHEQFNS